MVVFNVYKCLFVFDLMFFKFNKFVLNIITKFVFKNGTGNGSNEFLIIFDELFSRFCGCACPSDNLRLPFCFKFEDVIIFVFFDDSDKIFDLWPVFVILKQLLLIKKRKLLLFCDGVDNVVFFHVVKQIHNMLISLVNILIRVFVVDVNVFKIVKVVFDCYKSLLVVHIVHKILKIKFNAVRCVVVVRNQVVKRLKYVKHVVHVFKPVLLKLLFHVVYNCFQLVNVTENKQIFYVFHCDINVLLLHF